MFRLNDIGFVVNEFYEVFVFVMFRCDFGGIGWNIGVLLWCNKKKILWVKIIGFGGIRIVFI